MIEASDASLTDSEVPGRGLGVGIVGGGFMAQVHSRSARLAGARLVALSSSSPERAAEAAARYGVESAVDSFEALLAQDAVDVVHVCTPNGLHAEQAAAALAAGKHVVCEKPLATTVGDAEALVATAADTDRVDAVPFIYRFLPLAREARARIADGSSGTLLTINASYLQDWLLAQTDDNWRVDPTAGGASRAFADIGSHLVDMLEFVTGDRITALAASTRTLFTERSTHQQVTNEDAVALTLRTASGVIGTLLVSQVAPGRKNRLHFEIAGTEQSLVFNGEFPEELWLGRRDNSVLLPRDPDQLGTEARRLSIVPAGHPLGYQNAFDAFVADTYRTIAGEQVDGLPRFADGLRAGRITQAVLDSAAGGEWVELSTEGNA